MKFILETEYLLRISVAKTYANQPYRGVVEKLQKFKEKITQQ